MTFCSGPKGPEQINPNPITVERHDQIESAKNSGHYPGLNHTRNQDRQRMQKSGVPYTYEKAPFRGGLARETELLSV
jgi:hypothetical protein